MGSCLSASAAAQERKNREVDAAFGNDSIHVMMNKPPKNGQSGDDGGYVPRAPMGSGGGGGGGGDTGGYRPASSMDALRAKQRQKEQEAAGLSSSDPTAPESCTEESS
mmetsp:Transcript_29851/g.65703  ORF Transcript_29851/g.65703 Transcript_29851/m.65703 type:complete len:108 (-) Transcript_29851:243-566(-)|eukprot:CAMPEP_0178551272 /NCGR_PEP_ID=MMETSP0697-20121206/6696_1 /TAXON_ID=265572 /ORGANISM="Extubocellulus spinifer, Strain CCMP396" /LENGTH=107 /DNA_ID=CAMNT_0020184113 /DNA_START=831 /DNA_END=1154 /DNA_ORIENTATION=-